MSHSISGNRAPRENEKDARSRMEGLNAFFEVEAKQQNSKRGDTKIQIRCEDRGLGTKGSAQSSDQVSGEKSASRVEQAEQGSWRDFHLDKESTRCTVQSPPQRPVSPQPTQIACEYRMTAKDKKDVEWLVQHMSKWTTATPIMWSFIRLKEIVRMRDLPCFIKSPDM